MRKKNYKGGRMFQVIGIAVALGLFGYRISKKDCKIANIDYKIRHRYEIEKKQSDEFKKFLKENHLDEKED